MTTLAEAVEESDTAYSEMLQAVVRHGRGGAPAVVRCWRGDSQIAIMGCPDPASLTLSVQAAMMLLGADLVTAAFDRVLAGMDIVTGREWDEPWPIDPDGSIGRVTVVYGANRAGDNLYRRTRWNWSPGTGAAPAGAPVVRRDIRVREDSFAGFVLKCANGHEQSILAMPEELRDAIAREGVPWRECADVAAVMSLASMGVGVALEEGDDERVAALSKAAKVLTDLVGAPEWVVFEDRDDDDDA